MLTGNSVNNNHKLVSNKSLNNKINDNNKQKIPISKNSNNKILLDRVLNLLISHNLIMKL